MCKSIYSPEVMIDAIELGKQIGMLKASQKLHIPYTTAVNWRKVYNHPEAFPSHAITKHYASLSNSKTEITPDKIELKAENESVDIELKVAVKPDVTKEIKGSYEQLHNNSRSYMPEFKEFAVALADKIGDEAATVELGLRNHHIANWRSNLNCELKEARRIIQSLQADKKELQKQIANLDKSLTKAVSAQYENEQFRKYIASRITDEVISSILQK